MKQLLSFIFLLLAFSSFAQEKPEGLFINSKAPDFKAKDQNGVDINLKDIRKKGPVVIIFYRGNWCPYCNKELTRLQDSFQLMVAIPGPWSVKKAFMYAELPKEAQPCIWPGQMGRWQNWFIDGRKCIWRLAHLASIILFLVYFSICKLASPQITYFSSAKISFIAGLFL